MNPRLYPFIFLYSGCAFLMWIIPGCEESSVENASSYVDVVERVKIDVQSEDYPGWSDLIAHVDYIPLENTEILVGGDMFQLEASPHHWVVWDPVSADKVFFFDKKGKFIHMINQLGKGPGEYTYINKVQMSPDYEQILVHDSKLRKAIVYDTAGIFVKEHTLSYMFNDFIWLKENEIYLATGHTNQFNEELHYHLFLVDTFFNILDTMIPYEESKFKFSIGTANRIQKNSIWSTIVPDLSNMVYRVGETKAKPLYVIDFGSYWPSDDFFAKNKNLGTLELSDKMESRKYVKYFGAEENNKWLILHFYTFHDVNDIDKLHIYLYDKKDQQIYYVSPDRDTFVHAQPLQNSMYFNQNKLFWAVSAYELKYWVETHIAKGYEIDPNLTKLYEKLDENDNPVIVQVHLRNDR